MREPTNLTSLAYRRRRIGGLSQANLAAWLGISPGFVYRIERADREGRPVPAWYTLALTELERRFTGQDAPVVWGEEPPSPQAATTPCYTPSHSSVAR